MLVELSPVQETFRRLQLSATFLLKNLVLSLRQELLQINSFGSSNVFIKILNLFRKLKLSLYDQMHELKGASFFPYDLIPSEFHCVEEVRVFH